MPHQVCIAISGPQGEVHRRHVCALRQGKGPPVHVSSVQDGPSSPAEGRSVSRCSDDSDRSSAGNSYLVPGTSGPVPRRSHPAARRRSATADSGRHSVRRGQRLVTTRCIFSQENSQRQLVVPLLPEVGFLAKNQLPSPVAPLLTWLNFNPSMDM